MIRQSLAVQGGAVRIATVRDVCSLELLYVSRQTEDGQALGCGSKSGSNMDTFFLENRGLAAVLYWQRSEGTGLR